MCAIFSGQAPESYAYRSRSLRLNGYSTSLRLEDRFWRLLDEIAEDQGMSTPKFIATLHDEVAALERETQNFTSLLRCTCLVYLEQKAGAGAAPKDVRAA
ncbi:MAG: ribbon-helix-helix domain-containing protein [Rhodobacteraceae bacterium]|nr:ribbon-helix-helix domain-containing protein [Paracoccaceae bacterium]